MSIVLIVSGIILLCSSMALLMGFLEENELFLTLGMIGLVMSIGFGFGIIGGLRVEKTNTEILNVDTNTISRCKTAVTLKVDNIFLTSEKVEHYQAPDWQFKVQKQTKLNAYGSVIESPTYTIFVDTSVRP